MGANSSSFSSLSSNELLKKFVSPEIISYNDPFWNSLLSFASKVPRSSGDSRLLDENIESLFHELVKNSPQSGNLGTLISVFLARGVELKESARCNNSLFVWHAHNALLIVRVVTKLLLEHYTEDEVLQILSLQRSESSIPASIVSCGSPVSQLLRRVVCILVELPLSPTTSALHLEAITALTVFLSAQLVQRSDVQHRNKFFRLLHESCGSKEKVQLMETLMLWLIQRPPPPPDPDSSGSFVAGLAAGLWSVLTLGLAGKDAADGADNEAELALVHKDVPPSPLADQSQLLLLVLATHTTHNTFRDVFFSCTNERGPDTGELSLPFADLYAALTLTLHTEQTTLLLYMLLHNCRHFRLYVLSRSDVEALVLPLLQALYFASKLSSHHVYMALIVLLMLSEDTAFNAALHDIPAGSVSWFTERPLSNMSLGDLLILVLIRTITFNMTKMRDRYLHSNCLAALANMSSQFRSVHPHVCERLTCLLETLARRHARVCESIKTSENHDNHVVVCDQEDELLSDLSVIEEVLRMVLEIINSTLTHQLAHNSQLLYTLLYKRHIFLPFSTQPNFSDVCMNIDVVLNYLMNKLENSTTDPSVSDVLQVIEEGVLQLPKDRLHKFPELKFKYVEESSPEEFFMPYVWTLVYQSSGLYWNPSRVSLIDPIDCSA